MEKLNIFILLILLTSCGTDSDKKNTVPVDEITPVEEIIPVIINDEYFTNYKHAFFTVVENYVFNDEMDLIRRGIFDVNIGRMERRTGDPLVKCYKEPFQIIIFDDIKENERSLVFQGLASCALDLPFYTGENTGQDLMRENITEYSTFFNFEFVHRWLESIENPE